MFTPPKSLRIASAILLPHSLLAVPTGTNLSFENGLTGWNATGVAVETGLAADGAHRLDLQSGSIEQTITGLSSGQVHTLYLSYLGQSGTGVLSEARVFLDGVSVGELRTGQTNEYLSCNGFEFTPSASSIAMRIESLESGSSGLLIDDLRITLGGLPAPPAESWANLVVLPNGDRQLVNGGFESSLGDPSIDPNNSGPVGNEHLCGDSLPGWRVTRENVDVIQFNNANPPEGTNALDTSGHGPGGIAQTITGLTPGGAYTFHFQHARHRWWETRDMTGEVYINGALTRSLVRTIEQTWDDGYETVSIPAIADQAGTLTIEVISTVDNKGGSIIYDDFRLSAGGDFFTQWAGSLGITADPASNDDRDAFPNGLDFMLGLDPNQKDVPLQPLRDGGSLILEVPITGVALSQGFQLELMTSQDLTVWRSANDPLSGVTLISDTSALGIDGIRRYRIESDQSQLFWNHKLTVPD